MIQSQPLDCFLNQTLFERNCMYCLKTSGRVQYSRVFSEFVVASDQNCAGVLCSLYRFLVTAQSDSRNRVCSFPRSCVGTLPGRSASLKPIRRLGSSSADCMGSPLIYSRKNPTVRGCWVNAVANEWAFREHSAASTQPTICGWERGAGRFPESGVPLIVPILPTIRAILALVVIPRRKLTACVTVPTADAAGRLVLIPGIGRASSHRPFTPSPLPRPRSADAKLSCRTCPHSSWESRS